MSTEGGAPHKCEKWTPGAVQVPSVYGHIAVAHSRIAGTVGSGAPKLLDMLSGFKCLLLLPCCILLLLSSSVCSLQSTIFLPVLFFPVPIPFPLISAASTAAGSTVPPSTVCPPCTSCTPWTSATSSPCPTSLQSCVSSLPSGPWWSSVCTCTVCQGKESKILGRIFVWSKCL